MPPATQQARLRRWRQEWEIYRALSVDDDPSENPDESGPPARLPGNFVPAFETDPETFRPGAVRLLDASLVSGADRPVYVLILADWSRDRKLIAPFSPFRTPASTLEMQTEREEAFLAVLSLWNQRTMAQETIAKSWFVTRLENDEFEDILLVWKSGMLGDPLPAHLRTVLGSPIEEEDDPRCAYQREEVALFAALDAEMFASLGVPEVEPRTELVLVTALRAAITQIRAEAGQVLEALRGGHFQGAAASTEDTPPILEREISLGDERARLSVFRDGERFEIWLDAPPEYDGVGLKWRGVRSEPVLRLRLSPRGQRAAGKIALDAASLATFDPAAFEIVPL